MTVDTRTLTARTDPAFAVDRVLSPIERATFTKRLNITGGWQGSTPADYIDQARDQDAHIGVTDPWWEVNGEPLLTEMNHRFDLPAALNRPVLSSALIACVALGMVSTSDEAEPVLRIAYRAGAYLQGFADALGGWDGVE